MASLRWTSVPPRRIRQNVSDHRNQKEIDASLSMLVGAFGFVYAFFQNVAYMSLRHVAGTGIAGHSYDTASFRAEAQGILLDPGHDL